MICSTSPVDVNHNTYKNHHTEKTNSRGSVILNNDKGHYLGKKDLRILYFRTAN